MLRPAARESVTLVRGPGALTLRRSGILAGVLCRITSREDERQRDVLTRMGIAATVGAGITASTPLLERLGRRLRSEPAPRGPHHVDQELGRPAYRAQT
ncbi:hypothetical protein KPP03845_200281 (plasmid) [Streptomyces xanthophaeus]|nr:hypothetical protein KPP03845_200281 [Streptomyces xanthophaeus]